MRNGPKNRMFHRSGWIAVVVIASVLCGFGAEQLPLPPLAKVTSVESRKSAWCQSGEISGNVVGLHGDFSAVMARGGWVLNKTIVMGRGLKRSELMLWSKGGQRVLLMIWEKSAGKCGFSWGYDR